MASLMETLIDVLEKENENYVLLTSLSREKTDIIVKGNVAGINAITDKEQEIVTNIAQLEKSREEIIADIASVLNEDAATLKLSDLVNTLEKRPEEQVRLATIQNALRDTIEELSVLNERNKTLIENALDMVEFDLTLARSLNQAPDTANYDRSSTYQTGAKLGGYTKFDSKQ